MQSALLQKGMKKMMAALLTMLLTLSFFAGVTRVLGQEQEAMPEAAEEIVANGAVDPPADENTSPAIPVSENLKIELEDVEANPSFLPSGLLTAGLKLTIRGKEALAWVLAIENAGFDTPALQTTYRTVLTIVNSLFIVGMLGIALLWIFSVMIPRHRIKRVMLTYVFAVLLVNFALPFTRLLIDSANLLERTLLTRDGNPIGIVDIVAAPPYAEAVGYENQETLENQTQNKTFSITFPSLTGEPIALGTLSPSQDPVGIQGSLGGATGGPIQLQLQPGLPEELTLRANQPLQANLQTSQTFSPTQEHKITVFLLLGLTGLAYLGLAAVLILRLVILWGLLIISPLLVLFAIFNATRGYFYNWLSLYGRWLLLGPLIALGLSVTVGIWKTVGVPILSGYALNPAAEHFAELTNLRFTLPGSNAINTLSTTNQMMEYLVFLAMLYLPLFFGFALTRQKMWQQAATVVTEKFGERPGKVPEGNRERTGPEEPGKAEPRKEGWMGQVKDFAQSQISRITKTVLPQNLRNDQAGGSTEKRGIIPSSANFLPENLALTPVPQMLDLLGANVESRASREKIIEKLAAPELILDPSGQKNFTAVREEITTRASQGDPEAVILQNEIQMAVTLMPQAQAETSHEPSAPSTPSPTETSFKPLPEGIKEEEDDTIKLKDEDLI